VDLATRQGDKAADAAAAEALLARRFEAPESIKPEQSAADAQVVKEKSRRPRRPTPTPRPPSTPGSRTCRTRRPWTPTRKRWRGCGGPGGRSEGATGPGRVGREDATDRRRKVANLLSELDPAAAWQQRVARVVGLRAYRESVGERVDRLREFARSAQAQAVGRPGRVQRDLRAAQAAGRRPHPHPAPAAGDHRRPGRPAGQGGEGDGPAAGPVRHPPGRPGRRPQGGGRAAGAADGSRGRAVRHPERVGDARGPTSTWKTGCRRPSTRPAAPGNPAPRDEPCCAAAGAGERVPVRRPAGLGAYPVVQRLDWVDARPTPHGQGADHPAEGGDRPGGQGAADLSRAYAERSQGAGRRRGVSGRAAGPGTPTG
jgi:hypothetical protein